MGRVSKPQLEEEDTRIGVARCRGWTPAKVRRVLVKGGGPVQTARARRGERTFRVAVCAPTSAVRV